MSREAIDSEAAREARINEFNNLVEFFHQSGVVDLATEQAAKIPGASVSVEDIWPQYEQPGAMYHPVVTIRGQISPPKEVESLMYDGKSLETSQDSLSIEARNTFGKRSLHLVHRRERIQTAEKVQQNTEHVFLKLFNALYPVRLKRSHRESNRSMVLGSRVSDIPLTQDQEKQAEELENAFKRAGMIEA